MDSAGWMEWVARLLEWAGVGIILAGAVLATGKFVRDLGAGTADAYADTARTLAAASCLGWNFWSAPTS